MIYNIFVITFLLLIVVAMLVATAGIVGVEILLQKALSGTIIIGLFDFLLFNHPVLTIEQPILLVIGAVYDVGAVIYGWNA